jgi:hypothetical protein
VPNVLGVSAIELRDPVPLVVHPIADDASRHTSLPNAPVLIEVDPDVLLEPANDGTQEMRQTIDLAFEVGNSGFERRRALALVGDLALLIQIPEESHGRIIG